MVRYHLGGGVVGHEKFGQNEGRPDTESGDSL